MLVELYKLLVVNKQKAIVAAVASSAALYLAKVGVSLDMTVNEAIITVAGGAINGLLVYLKRNQ